MDIVTEKKCCKCKDIKNVNEFGKNSSMRDGLQRQCKSCCKENGKKWYEKNKKLGCANARDWYLKNKEIAIQNNKSWRERNKQKSAEYSHKWRENNPQKMGESRRSWQKNNPEKSAVIGMIWRRKNPGKCIEYNHKRRARVFAGGGSFTSQEWEDLKTKFNNTCLCCGIMEKLTADHVIPVSKGGSSNIDNIQPLCKTCNSSKGVRIIDYRK